ncbi:hypothetical protein G9C98_002823 [Cotesia typhae]|uniref:Uncharacterized protein n=1 Tax=Cotesia typhae TaxID=2053667 RepID=A0A8J5R869_9HYME|nr:hypothetical protein G9C98_002823 [Cotesia typhae]
MNFINVPYKIKKEDYLLKTDIKKLLLQRESPRISGSNRLRSYYYITKSPQTADAIEFGFPHFRNWYLQITYSGFMKDYYTLSDLTSVMQVFLFNFCGLAIKNLKELVQQSEDQKLCYARELQQSADVDNENESESDNAEPDCEDIDEHDDKNLSKMEIEENPDCLLPEIFVDDESRWAHVTQNELSLHEFCKYVEYGLGKGVVRLLRIPIQIAYDKARVNLYSYKYIQEDLGYLMLSLCPSLHDILTYISFCNYLIKTSDHGKNVSSIDIYANTENNHNS